MTEHLSDERLRQFVQHRLPPADLRAAEDHLAACDECRARAARFGDPRRSLERTPPGLAAGEHLTKDEMQRLVAGAMPAPERGRLREHVEVCEDCARGLRRLESWAAARALRRRMRYLAAAAVLAVAVAAGVMSGLFVEDVSRERSPLLAGLESLPDEPRRRVERALQAGAAGPPAAMLELSGSAEAPVGTTATAEFRPLRPLGTLTMTDRPTFEWQPLPGATEYLVGVFDMDMRPVVRSPLIKGTIWTPGAPVPRGQAYVWQVTAGRKGEMITTPAPPAPPARFAVMDEATADTLQQVARDHPDSHLLLGILFTQAGARAEAEEHLRRVPAGDPGARVAQATLDRLRGTTGR